MNKPLQNPTKASFKGNPKKAEMRARVIAFWRKNPTLTVREVAEACGVGPSTAQNLKPRDVRRMVEPTPHDRGHRDARDKLALKMYYEDVPLVDIAAATGRSISTTLRFLRANARPDLDPIEDTKPQTPDPAPTCTIYSVDGSSWIEGGNT